MAYCMFSSCKNTDCEKNLANCKMHNWSAITIEYVKDCPDKTPPKKE
jgi:hypothetical protein